MDEEGRESGSSHNPSGAPSSIGNPMTNQVFNSNSMGVTT